MPAIHPFSVDRSSLKSLQPSPTRSCLVPVFGPVCPSASWAVVPRQGVTVKHLLFFLNATQRYLNLKMHVFSRPPHHHSLTKCSVHPLPTPASAPSQSSHFLHSCPRLLSRYRAGTSVSICTLQPEQKLLKTSRRFLHSPFLSSCVEQSQK